MFFCTSTEPTKSITASVEVFGKLGGVPLNSANADDEGLNPGGTAVWATNPQNTFVQSEDLGFAGVIDHGSARIVSTSTKIVCGAVVVNALSSANGMVNLPVVQKLKQKGD